MDAFHIGYLKFNDVLCLAHEHFEVRSLRVSPCVLILEQRVFVYCETQMCLGWDTLSRIIFVPFRFLLYLLQHFLVRIDRYGLSRRLWKVELSSSDEPPTHQVIVEEREDRDKFPTHF